MKYFGQGKAGSEVVRGSPVVCFVVIFSVQKDPTRGGWGPIHRQEFLSPK